MDVGGTLPAWARPTLEALARHERVGDLVPRPLDAQGKKELHAVAWVVDTYMRYDENEAIDDAMHQPGRVLTGSTELNFEGGSGDVDATLLGQDKEGRPVALLMEQHEGVVEAYSVQDLGEVLYVQGGRLDLAGGRGFYLSGALYR